MQHILNHLKNSICIYFYFQADKLICKILFSLISFVLRENDHLLLQAKPCGEAFQRNAGGSELHWLRLLPPVLQDRDEGAPASGGMNYF